MNGLARDGALPPGSCPPRTLVNHLTKQVVFCPSQVFDLGYELRANPMHSAEDGWRAEAVRPRWGLIERHLRNGEWL